MKRLVETKRYVGTKDLDNTNLKVEVVKYEQEWQSNHYHIDRVIETKPLEHKVYHSPTGFNWGYGGSGPADLARSILFDYLGCEPIPKIYQKFKMDFIAKYEKNWVIEGETIADWLLINKWEGNIV